MWGLSQVVRAVGKTSLLILSAGWLFTAGATTYEIGPGKALAKIGDVPWRQLKPGDQIFIYWRAEPYREKWVIPKSGTVAAPIVVKGVPNAAGQLPVIDGRDAVTSLELRYDNSDRSIIQIGGSNFSVDDETPSNIIIDSLEVVGARTGGRYTINNVVIPYLSNAAGVFVQRGQNITIRNCSFHDNGDGVFVGIGKDVTLEYNHIYDNGYGNDDDQHHNVYLQSAGLVVQYNWFGPLKAGSQGNNIKDRSAGTVIRYNWIEGGNRQLDLVEINISEINSDPRYKTAYVYGNVLVEYQANDNNQFAHFGGDGADKTNYRKGTIYFYNNTLVSFRNKDDETTLIRLSDPEEKADIRNNVIYMANGSTFRMSYDFGSLDLRNNVFPRAWIRAHDDAQPVVVRDLGGNQFIDDPGFVDVKGLDFHLGRTSGAIAAGTALAAGVSNDYAVTREYVKHQTSRARARGAQDMGAYEASAVPTPRLTSPLFRGPIAPYSYISIYGQDLSRSTRLWASTGAGDQIPTELDGVRVRVNGRDAYVTFVSPSQLNVLTPPDTMTGTVPVEVVTPFGTVNGTATLAATAPAFFTLALNGKAYPAAYYPLEPTLTLVAPPGSIAGADSRAAKAGDYIALYATGLGRTDPDVPYGVVLPAAYPVADLTSITVTIGTAKATVLYAGMTFAGLFQVNIQVPDGVAVGDQPITIRAGSAGSTDPVFLSVGQ